jgi:hypothetical protein
MAVFDFFSCVGLPALYTDPQTRLHYASTEEFAEIRRLPSDIIQGRMPQRIEEILSVLTFGLGNRSGCGTGFKLFWEAVS